MVEKAGLVKFDFLGLKTLTVIQVCLDHVNRERAGAARAARSGAIPLDDAEVYKMISQADVTGVFQLESSGFRELLKKLRPDCFEDIVAAGALYRPGPLEGGMVDDFIERKHGRKKVEYDHPTLEPILKDTYGVIVYQEQVMQISSALAGYSLGKADLLRRAMGKKKAEVMAKEKAGFLDGAKAKKVDGKIAERVFDLMEKFAGYGFNRSHSAAYGLLTYQTAYLKRYFPVEFFAALLTCDKDDTDAVVKFIAEAKANGIAVLRPDMNESDTDFSVVAMGENGSAKKVIRFGLGAVKGVGEGAVEIMKAAREQGGPFLTLFDFCKRVDGRKVNRKVVEALVKAGAFDGIAGQNKITRSRMFSAIALASERAAEAQRERESGQTNLLRCSPEPGSKIGPGLLGEDKYPRPRSGCRRSCSPTRRSRSASTSAATRWTAIRARSAASPPRRARTACRWVSVTRRSWRRHQRVQRAALEERDGQDRLLQPRGSDRTGRVLRQLEEARGVPRDPLARRADAGHRRRRGAMGRQRRQRTSRAPQVPRRQAAVEGALREELAARHPIERRHHARGAAAGAREAAAQPRGSVPCDAAHGNPEAQRNHPGPRRRLQGRRQRRASGAHRANLRRARRCPKVMPYSCKHRASRRNRCARRLLTRTNGGAPLSC
jgi:hypothetical protein